MARLFTPSESKYYLMALDAGTGSIRAVIFDLEGNQIAVGQAEWRHLAVPDVPGSMEFDLNKNWQLACECMRQALHNAGIAPEYIAAVSACSMREGIVLYNNEGTPIWACEIWGLVIVNEHDNHDRQRLDSSLVYIGAHNVYYVKFSPPFI